MSPADTAWAWPWWTVMVLVNSCNLVLCALLYRRSRNAVDGHTAYMRAMRLMGLVFALVAVYRAVFVSRYLTQMAWFDTLANSSLIIRSFAVFAELSFSGLVAFAMLRFNRDLSFRPAWRYGQLESFLRLSPYILIVCIFSAQFFATTGLITKSRLAFAIEETLWFVGFLAITPLAILQFRHVRKQQLTSELSMLRSFAFINLGWCVIYCTYGAVFHLPFEYWSAAFEQLRTGVPAIKTGWGAVSDALLIINPSVKYGDWGFAFLLWHSAYFSICVWLALFLMRGPRLLQPAGR
jgi:hypothetical protein